MDGSGEKAAATPPASRRHRSATGWEKAARGTDGRRYAWGNAIPDGLYARAPDGVGFVGTHEPLPVGSRAQLASPYGVLDMGSNVYEWVADRYDPSYYRTGPATDPRGPENASERVIRGGPLHWRQLFLHREEQLFDPNPRLSLRFSRPPSSAAAGVGFRCARSQADTSFGAEIHRTVRGYARWLGARVLPGWISDPRAVQRQPDVVWVGQRPGATAHRLRARVIVGVQIVLCTAAGYVAGRRGRGAFAFSIQSLIVGAAGAGAAVTAGRAAYQATHDPGVFMANLTGLPQGLGAGLAAGAVAGLLATLVVNLPSSLGNWSWARLLRAGAGYAIGIIAGSIGLWAGSVECRDPLLVVLYLTGWIAVGSFMVAGFSVPQPQRRAIPRTAPRT